MEGVLLIGGGSKIPSEDCQSTPEQGRETIKCSHGPGMSWRPVLGLTVYVNPPHDPKREKVVKKTRRQLAPLF